MSFERMLIPLLPCTLLLCALLTGCSGENSTSGHIDTSTASAISGDAQTNVKSDAIELSGRSGVIKLEKEGEYRFCGVLENGQLLIDADKNAKIRLILDGCTLKNPEGAAIYVKSVDRLTIEAAAGSENFIVSDGDFPAIDGDNVDAAIFSKDDLTLTGEGSLTVSSAKNGISGKDDLKIEGGILNITAAAHALEANDSLEIEGGELTLVAGKDAIRAENGDAPENGIVAISGAQLDITSDGDGIYASGSLEVSGGELALVCGGGSSEPPTDSGFGFFRPSSSSSSNDDSTSAKGLKSDGRLKISGGVIAVDSADDSLHAGGELAVDGGELTLRSTDDAIHSDAGLLVKDGKIQIERCYEGLEGLSIDIEGGDISLSASDDGINAAGGVDGSGFGGMRGGDRFAASSDSAIKISGGIIRIDADGDGIDSNGSLEISGGEVYVSGPTSSGNGALDYDGSGKVSGGIVVAVGAAGMAQGFSSDSTQPSFTVDLQSGGGRLTVSDSSGRVLIECELEKGFQCAVISHPELKIGEAYTVSVGEVKTSVTLTDIVTGGGFGGFGRPGGFGNFGANDRPDGFGGRK